MSGHPKRLYDVDRKAYHEAVHQQLVELGFDWIDVRVPIGDGLVITRVYHKEKVHDN